MACFNSSLACFNNLDNLELSLGEFCDLIQTDDADAAVLAAEAPGMPWSCTDPSTTCKQAAAKQQDWGSSTLDGVHKAQYMGNSSSSLLSDSEMFMKQERNTSGWHVGQGGASVLPLGQSSSHLPNLQTKQSDAATNDTHRLGMMGCEGSPHGSGSPTRVSAASMQQLPPASQPHAALHPVLQHATSLSSGLEDEFDAMSRPPVSHSSVEKQRRDRLNNLIEKLSTIVPPSDNRYLSAGPGARRPKHVVLSDTIRSMRAYQEHMRSCNAATGACVKAAAPMPVTPRTTNPDSPTSAAPDSTTPSPPGFHATAPSFSSALEMPLLLDIPATSTGVMVEAPAGSRVWRLRVTCRDRPGLLADVAIALRSLPVNLTAASITTTLDGKAQQVFELAVLDSSLAPEEVQCAVNASLYAHLLSSSAAPPTAGAGKPAAELPSKIQPPAKRSRLA